MAFRITVLIACLSVFSMGCSSLSMSKLNKNSVESEAASATITENTSGNLPPIRNAAAPPAQYAANQVAPARMAVIWNEKVLNMPSAAPVRGYAGRIYFYDANDQPIRVRGELTVYGYDDSKEVRSNAADNKYVFPADKFQEHYNESELGPAYSVWVPWENPEGFRKPISLVPIFNAGENLVIQGGATRLTLSGKKPPGSTIEKKVISSPIGTNQRQPMAGGNAYNHSQQQGMPQRPQVQSFPIPRNISSHMSDVEASRYSPVANQQLDQAMSSSSNPNGELFNRTSSQNFQMPNSQQPFVPTGQMSNFSDDASMNAQRGIQQIQRAYNNRGQLAQQPNLPNQPNQMQQGQAQVHPYNPGQVSQPGVAAPQPVRSFGRPGPIR